MLNLIFLVKRQAYTKEDVLGLLKVLLEDENKVNRFLESMEFDFSYSFRGGEARLRGNAFVSQGNYGIALRLIPQVKTIAVCRAILSN